MKNITFNEYVRMIEKWKNNNDFREINIQNEVVKPFIEALGDEFDVIDVSIWHIVERMKVVERRKLQHRI